MYVLAIDTATDTVVTGVAELSGEATGLARICAQRSVSDHRRHAEVLTTLIAESLEESGVARADLAAVVVGCGPGPFTGLRVGMATGAAFADALAIPAHPVCSLDAVAAQQYADDPSLSSVLVVTDARRREIYWARYVDRVRVSGPDVTAPADVVEAVATEQIDVVVGSPTHTALFDRPVGSGTVPTVAGLVEAARPELVSGAAPAPLTPLYLRRPDAVERAPAVNAAGRPS